MLHVTRKLGRFLIIRRVLYLLTKITILLINLLIPSQLPRDMLEAGISVPTAGKCYIYQVFKINLTESCVIQ